MLLEHCGKGNCGSRLASPLTGEGDQPVVVYVSGDLSRLLSSEENRGIFYNKGTWGS